MDGVWSQTQKVLIEVAFYTIPGVSGREIVGEHIAMSGDTIVLGSNRNVMRILRRKEGVWSHEQTIAIDGKPALRHNFAIAMDDRTLAISSVSLHWNEEDRRFSDVNVFEREGDVWVRGAQLRAPAQVVGERFGSCLALEGDNLLISCPNKKAKSASSEEDDKVAQGMVYHFRKSGGDWNYSAEFSHIGDADIYVFASEIALHNNHVLAVSVSDGPTVKKLTYAATSFRLPAPATAVMPDVPEYWIGGMPNGDENLTSPLRIADVQVWNAARSGQVIKDTMYLPLIGREFDLAGYWRMGAILPGDTRKVVDFSRHNHDAPVHGDAFVAAAILGRNLRMKIKGKPVKADRFTNDDLVAVTSGGSYVERFEFKLDRDASEDASEADRHPVPPAGLFTFDVWGKQSRGAVTCFAQKVNEATDVQADFGLQVEPFVPLHKKTPPGEDIWYVAECNYQIPSNVTLLRSFGLEILDSKFDWDQLSIRNYTITNVSESITQAEYIEHDVSLVAQSDDTLAEAALFKLGKLEVKEGALWREKAALEMQLHHPDRWKILLERKKKDIADKKIELANSDTPIKQAKKELEYAQNHARFYYDSSYRSRGGIAWGRIGKSDYHGTGWDGIISSVKIPEGLVVTLFDGAAQTGDKLKLTEDCDYVGGTGKHFNDRTTSVLVSTTGGYTSKDDIQRAIHAAEVAQAAFRAELKVLQNDYDEMLDAQHSNRRALENRLDAVKDALRDITGKMAPLNGTVLTGIAAVQQTSHTMNTLATNAGLTTFGAMLRSVRPSGKMTVLDSCEGNLRFSYMDEDCRMRAAAYDTRADYKNSKFEEWLPDGLRAAVDFQHKDAVIKLQNPVELPSTWTIEAWVLLPLRRGLDDVWSPETYWTGLAGSADGAEAMIAVQSNPDQGAHLLGTRVGGVFSSSGYDLTLLGTGWHHITAVGEKGLMTFYVDGAPVSPTVTNISAKQPMITQTAVAHIGSLQGGEQFGKVAEICVWGKALPASEVAANALVTPSGNEPELLAYFPLQEAKGNEINDVTGNNHKGVLSGGSWGGCAAPIGYLGRNVVKSALVTYEYSQVTTVGRHKETVMRQGHAYCTEKGVEIVPDRPIEELDLIWVGNCQFEPTLLGYIEGPPPIPSENLTEKANYAGATSVKLTQSDDVDFSWNRSEDAGMVAKTKFFAGAKDKGSTIIGISKLLYEYETGASGEIDTEYGQTAKSKIASHMKTSTTNALALRGTQEKTAKFPALGKRFIPKNVGYALVISGLADVFISKLRRSGRMVAYETVPVEDVAPDINTITFLMNPAYTMAGSLDGLTGSKATSDRFFKHVPEMRSQYGSRYPASYLRLQEAYALKSQIDRQDQERASYFENFQSDKVDILSLRDEASKGNKVGSMAVPGETGNGSSGKALSDKDKKDAEIAQAEQVQKQCSANKTKTKAAADKKHAQIKTELEKRKDKGHAGSGFAYWQESMEAIQSRSGKRNIVNNYVWDADGGMHTESQSFANTSSHTIGGTFSMEGRLGYKGDIAGEGVKVALEASAGFKLTQTLTKTESITHGLSLDISLSGVESAGVTDHDDYPLMPGEKVDRYRFMSFYLDGDTAHFTDFFNHVVDPEWLASNDEEARALRQAQGKPNIAWRVLHRVTYVERPALMGFGKD